MWTLIAHALPVHVCPLAHLFDVTEISYIASDTNLEPEVLAPLATPHTTSRSTHARRSERVCTSISRTQLKHVLMSEGERGVVGTLNCMLFARPLYKQ